MIGEGIVRTEGPLKVTGRAHYSYERPEAKAPLYGWVVGAGIGHGRIASMDTAAAEASPGVRLVWTYRNAPQQGAEEHRPDLLGGTRPQLVSDRIIRYGMPVAFIVAETLEQARAAAALIEVGCEADGGTFALPSLDAAEWERGSRIGNFELAMDESAVAVDATYSAPYQSGHPIELHACIADWHDGHLYLYLTAQILGELIKGLAATLMIPVEQITIDSAYIGGGFGSKIGLHAEAILASLATRALGVPVKLQMTRRQVFTLVGHRPASVSRVRLAASRDGRLTALGHDALVQTSTEDSWNEATAGVARALYAAPNRLTRHSYANVDVGAAEPVRGPGELAGLLVFESAMDEMAEKLGLDPVEFRLRNDTSIDPERNVPLSSRRLADCLREGAARFSWSDRPTRPASRRDGDWLIGWGVASSLRGHPQFGAEALVRLEADGRAIVRTDMTDIGTGTYTIAAQVVASALGIPVGQVKVELARTDYPKTWGSGGSWGAAHTSVSVDNACTALKQAIGEAAGTSYNDIFAEVRRHFPDGIERRGSIPKSGDDPKYQSHSQHTYGASFAEVGVDRYTGEIRLRRMLGVFAAGRIINPKTARSQLLGGMIWGTSAALFEGMYVDPRYGHWVNGDLAEYLIPTHADIPDIDAIMLDDFDEHANHMGVKGIGELGAGGTGGSVANAVYNATGVRVRDFPITLGRLLPGLIARG
ncbi:MAG: xanthine dehydrogenase family protein molybdopterin-binding subunit [Devosia sp.]